MIERDALLDYLSELLGVSDYQDYAPNGLQVEGRNDIARLMTGVTACRALVEAAIEWQADAILVHHGYFWRGEDVAITGMKRRRLKLLLDHDINLLAYHLPLDGHPELGNNAQLARRLGIRVEGRLDEDGRPSLLYHGRLDPPLTVDELAARLEGALHHPPLPIAAGDGLIATVGWCTGAAQGMIERAAAAGLDAYISGEISEPTVHVARELGIHYFAAGHHATERGGVEALGEHLAARFGITHRFVEIDNPA